MRMVARSSSTISAAITETMAHLKKIVVRYTVTKSVRTKTWGRELPEISRNTLSAANKLFEDYYASEQAVETGTVTA